MEGSARARAAAIGAKLDIATRWGNIKNAVKSFVNNNKDVSTKLKEQHEFENPTSAERYFRGQAGAQKIASAVSKLFDNLSNLINSKSVTDKLIETRGKEYLDRLKQVAVTLPTNFPITTGIMMTDWKVFFRSYDNEQENAVKEFVENWSVSGLTKAIERLVTNFDVKMKTKDDDEDHPAYKELKEEIKENIASKINEILKPGEKPAREMLIAGIQEVIPEDFKWTKPIVKAVADDVIKGVEQGSIDWDEMKTHLFEASKEVADAQMLNLIMVGLGVGAVGGVPGMILGVTVTATYGLWKRAGQMILDEAKRIKNNPEPGNWFSFWQWR